MSVWIPTELKTRLEQWRDKHATTYAEILNDALERHFEEGEDAADGPDIDDRVTLIEQQISDMREMLEQNITTPRRTQTRKSDQYGAPASTDDKAQTKQKTILRREPIRRNKTKP